ncbi:hypothetical protein PYW08_002653 [Mythimna loreyi]|uniref:Uncharacterized protein n=1 Tax=Mythimna loreyi TaxID=667449 RepID=A0ACC2QJ24_9NEOP|nr:hypothetical protein PYW08_002653 [Mythimna loreyi]
MFFFLSSIMGISKFPYLPIYCGSKMAVVQFSSQCLAMDPFYEKTGIRLMSMCLGATDNSLVLNLETKAWDQKLGNKMTAAVENGYTCQTRLSAVAALLDMFNTGAPATVWLSVDNKPVKDITSSIDRAFKDFEKILLRE